MRMPVGIAMTMMIMIFVVYVILNVHMGLIEDVSLVVGMALIVGVSLAIDVNLVVRMGPAVDMNLILRVGPAMDMNLIVRMSRVMDADFIMGMALIVDMIVPVLMPRVCAATLMFHSMNDPSAARKSAGAKAAGTERPPTDPSLPMLLRRRPRSPESSQPTRP